MYLYLESVLALIKSLHFYSCLVELPFFLAVAASTSHSTRNNTNQMALYQIFTSTVVAIECKFESEMCASLCSWKVRCVLHFVVGR